MNFTERRQRCRKLLGGDNCIYPPHVYDPISARIAEDLGFELAIVTNPGIAATVLAAPELVADVTLSLHEMAEQVSRITRASNLSLIVSTHQGYGNALKVTRAVEELGSAGVSGLSIDDTVQPVKGSVKGPKQLISLQEAVGKLEAALAARRDPALVIFAATRSLDSEGISHALRRIEAYAAAGVDGIHLGQGETEEIIATIHASTKLPLMVHHHKDVGDSSFLTAHGVRIVAATTGNLALYAAMKAQYDILKALRDGKSPDELISLQASPELRDRVLRKTQYHELIKKFLP